MGTGKVQENLGDFECNMCGQTLAYDGVYTCENGRCQNYRQPGAPEPVETIVHNGLTQCPKCKIPLDPNVNYICNNEGCPVLVAIPEAPVDYRRLLLIYMANVIDAEGVSFVNQAAYEVPPLTEQETALLNEIEQEARKEWNL